MRKSFPADQTSLSSVRTFVRAQSEGTKLSLEMLDELVMAVSEACTLILRHSLDPVIMLSWEFGGRAIEVTIEDEGVFAPWIGRSEVHEGESGLMEVLVDSVDVSCDLLTGRRKVRLIKRLPLPGT